MTSLLPPPGPEAQGPNPGHRKRGPKTQATDIPNIDEILAMFQKLNSLVMMRLISTAQANTIQRGLHHSGYPNEADARPAARSPQRSARGAVPKRSPHFESPRTFSPGRNRGPAHGEAQGRGR